MRDFLGITDTRRELIVSKSMNYFRKKHRSTADDIELSEQARNRENSTSNTPYFGGHRNTTSIPWWANDENLGVSGGGNNNDKSVYGGTRSDPGYVKRTLVASDSTVSDHVIVDDDGNVISKKNENKNKKEKKVLWRQVRVSTLTESEVYFNDKNSTQPVAASTSSTVVIASSSSPAPSSSPVAAVKDSTAASQFGPKVVPSSPTLLPNIHVRPQLYGGPLTVANYVVMSDRRPVAAASRPLNSSYRYTTTSSNLTPAVWRRY